MGLIKNITTSNSSISQIEVMKSTKNSIKETTTFYSDMASVSRNSRNDSLNEDLFRDAGNSIIDDGITKYLNFFKKYSNYK